MVSWMKKKHLLCSIAITALMLLASLSAMTSATPDFQEDQPHKTGICAYAAHAPINITGDADFAAQAIAEEWPGNGTQSNPYIISGLEIDAAVAPFNGIFVSLTDVHFKIDGCFVYGAMIANIMLRDISNATVINCTAVFGNVGIEVWSDPSPVSNNNTIADNICSGNRCGINIQNAMFNRVSGNQICNNSYYGITLSSARNNVIFNNTFSDSQRDGIALESFVIDPIYTSSNNTIFNNTMSDNTMFGVNISALSFDNVVWNNTISNNTGSSSTYSPSNAQAHDDGGRNSWNSSSGYGNWWSDLTAPDNVAPFDIIDWPYNLTGSAGAKDYCPRVDSEAPNTTASQTGTAGNNGWFISNVSISLSATDEYSGVNETFYRNGTSGNWTDYSYPLVLSDEGNHTTQFYSRDKVGNDEAVNSVITKIDKTAPKSAATVDGSSVTIQTSDAISGVNCTKYRVDNGTWQTYDGPFNVSGEGNHTVAYRSIDNAGNEEKIKTIYVDNGNILIIATLIVIIIVALLIGVAYMRNRNRAGSAPPSPPQS